MVQFSVTPSQQMSLAAWLALVVGCLIFAAKISAYLITDAVMILSDALESLVNIAAALMLILSIRYAARPPELFYSPSRM